MIVTKILYRLINKAKDIAIKRFFKKDQLLLLAYQENGVLNFGNEDITGEKYVLNDILFKYLEDKEAILFDIGANVGNYSKMLRDIFPKAKIFSFEPNLKIFNIAKKNLLEFNVDVRNIGFGSTDGSLFLYSYKSIANSELGTCHPEAFSILYKDQINDDVEKINFSVRKIDSFCNENKINHIDFLKIDVEGYELEVIKGAKEMIAKNEIDFIQFEFNEFNVVYRVFLRDFYLLLNDYSFYRIKNKELIKLGDYNSINEIFKYQNILAVSNKIVFNK